MNTFASQVLYLQSRVTPQFTAIAAGGDEAPVRFFSDVSCVSRCVKYSPALQNSAPGIFLFTCANYECRGRDASFLFFAGGGFGHNCVLLTTASARHTSEEKAGHTSSFVKFVYDCWSFHMIDTKACAVVRTAREGKGSSSVRPRV